MADSGVRIEGLAELRRALKSTQDTTSLPELRDGLKDAAEIVADEARSRVPVRSGRARSSVRATSGGNVAYVVGGKARVPYYPWLDFGSRRAKRGQSRRIGPWARSGHGPREGRYIYPALVRVSGRVTQAVERALDKAFDKLGV